MTDLYSYIFRALVAEDSLDRAGRPTSRPKESVELQKQYEQLGVLEMDKTTVTAAEEMAIVYTAIHAFENTVRSFISKKLQEHKGTDWWQTSVKQDIRKRAEQRSDSEQSIRWHSARGENLIDYTDFGDLIPIVAGNWDLFEAHIYSVDWAKEIITAIEKSRNVIMHGGVLKKTDIERIGIYIRDWLRQIGG